LGLLLRLDQSNDSIDRGGSFAGSARPAAGWRDPASARTRRGTTEGRIDRSGVGHVRDGPA
jgi:hypothetical protein